MIQDKLNKLEGLYSITGHDWAININHMLTEPVCPTVVIAPEGSNMVRYRVDADIIEEGIEKACELVHREIFLREKIHSVCPFTNPDDKHYEKWINERLAGSDEKLPEFPGVIPPGFKYIVREFLEKEPEFIKKQLEKESIEYIRGYLLSYLFGNSNLNEEECCKIIDEELGQLKLNLRKEE